MDSDNGAIDPAQLVLDELADGRAVRVGRQSAVTRRCPYIRGPIDLAWIATARELGVSALWMGLVLWYLKGVKKTNNFLVSNITTEKLGLQPDAKSRALRRLEEAGLIRVERRGRRSPRVTILSPLAARPDIRGTDTPPQ